MAVELPRDAEGREIQLDTVELFAGDGRAYNVTGWMYTTDFDPSNSTRGQWRALTDKFSRLDPGLMYLIQPDSWEKLEADLGKCMGPEGPCQYCGGPGACADGTRPDDGGGHACAAVFGDIRKRIRKLRGEDG